MKKPKSILHYSRLFVLASVALYCIHYLIFRDVEHIFIYLLGDIAFLPIEVLIVTLILHRVLANHEKRRLLEKLNMVIGAFFNEAGTEAAGIFLSFAVEPESINALLEVTGSWTEKDYATAGRSIRAMGIAVDSRKGDLPGLKDFLSEKRNFLLRLLENPNLLEHESFTALMWGLTHLSEELQQRRSLDKLPETDYEHISVDIKRAFLLLICEWLKYMSHLRSNYPYLYSLALRINPFNPSADPVVR